jgi:hypothetical protein
MPGGAPWLRREPQQASQGQTPEAIKVFRVKKAGDDSKSVQTVEIVTANPLVKADGLVDVLRGTLAEFATRIRGLKPGGGVSVIMFEARPVEPGVSTTPGTTVQLGPDGWYGQYGQATESLERRIPFLDKVMLPPADWSLRRASWASHVLELSTEAVQSVQDCGKDSRKELLGKVKAWRMR